MNTKIETLIADLHNAIVKSPCMLPDEVIEPINKLLAALRQAGQQAQPLKGFIELQKPLDGTSAKILRENLHELYADQQAQPVAEIKLVDVMGKGLQNHLIFKDGALNSLPVGTKFFTSPPAQPQAEKDQRVIEAAEKLRQLIWNGSNEELEAACREYDKAKQ